MNQPVPSRPRVQLPDRQQSMAGLTITMVMVLFLAFIYQYGQRVNDRQKAETVESEAIATMNAASTEQVALIITATYSASDAYLAEVAHGDMGMVKPGEKLVVPVTAEDPNLALPTATPFPTVTPHNYDRWWSMFFASNRQSNIP